MTITAPPASELVTVRGPIHVTPGTIDDAAIQAYTSGQCIALAYALADLTGWPVMAHLTRPGDPHWERQAHLADATDLPADWFTDFVHALVLTPDGDLLDINGPADAEDYRDAAVDQYGTCALVHATGPDLLAQHIQAGIDGHNAPRQDLPTAAAFAEALLAAHGYQ